MRYTFSIRFEDRPLEELTDVLGEFCEMISILEDEPVIEGITSDVEAIELRLSILKNASLIPAYQFQSAPLEEKDWIEENLRSFPPLTIGPFYFYGSHITSSIPQGLFAIKIDAETAFGSGHHETTRGCLLLIDKLLKREKLESALDLGCGSGILAMAIGKLAPEMKLVASDNDPEAVRIAEKNCQINGLESIDVLLSEGFETLAFQAFDLIVANILASPLIALSESIQKHLTSCGYTILSGLLIEQEEAVLQAYQKLGFTLVDKIHDGLWSALLLKK